MTAANIDSPLREAAPFVDASAEEDADAVSVDSDPDSDPEVAVGLLFSLPPAALVGAAVPVGTL